MGGGRSLELSLWPRRWFWHEVESCEYIYVHIALQMKEKQPLICYVLGDTVYMYYKHEYRTVHHDRLCLRLFPWRLSQSNSWNSAIAAAMLRSVAQATASKYLDERFWPISEVVSKPVAKFCKAFTERSRFFRNAYNWPCWLPKTKIFIAPTV